MGMTRHRMVSARQLIGRKIVGFDPRPFGDSRGGRAYKPAIYLDDGTRLEFITQETDGDDYGVLVLKVPSEVAKAMAAKEPTHAH